MEDILRANELYLQGDNSGSPLTVFFINCAGSIDVSSVLSLAPNITAYIVDSHRPFHLANIFENSQVVIFDDGELEERYEYLKELYQHSESLAAYSTESSDEEVEKTEEQDEHSDAENAENFALSPVANDAEALPEFDRKALRAKNRELMIQAQVQIEMYYSEFSYGTSAANLLYAMASSLSKENNDYLWNAILGTTEQFIFHQVSWDQYEQSVSLLKEEVVRMNTSISESPITDTSAYSDDYVEGRISFVPNEFCFALLRHWTLYESMRHCEYVASKLGVWKEKGIQKLEMILAKMAIPLKEANQSYEHLPFQYKSALTAQAFRVFPESGLDDISFPSFVRSYSYGFQASSSDIVYAIIASLQHFQSKNASTGWHDAFFHSFKILQSFATPATAAELLKPALHLAISNQKTLIRLASMILNRKAIKQFKNFRLVVIKEPVPNSFEYYSMFMLGHFLTKALEAFGKPNMPMVLASSHNFPHQHFKLLCISVWSQESTAADEPLNSLVHVTNFKQNAIDMSMEILMEGSQFCQVVVPADQLMEFVSRLV